MAVQLLRSTPGPGGIGTDRVPPRSGRPEPAAARPDLFAPKAEKRLFAAYQQAKAHAPADFWTATIGTVADTAPRYRFAALVLSGLLLHERDPVTARDLDEVLRAGADPADDPFLSRYCTDIGRTIGMDPVVAAVVPLGRDLVASNLADLFRQSGDLDQALLAAEQVSDPTMNRLLRIDLLVRLGRARQVVDLTDGIVNADNASAMLCVQRGTALRQLGQYPAALAAFREALRHPSRIDQLRLQARLERALTHVEMGQRAKAREDLVRVEAADSAGPGLQEALARLDGV